ncbi:MAG TPA: hypothetical protein VK625_00515 [Flavitalea sp.]|nr:hypothetical protein [Flavitalea sp.]
MRQIVFLSVLFAISSMLPVSGQGYDKLTELPDHSVKVFYSEGHEQRASAIANRVDKAMSYHSHLLGFQPEISLLILSAIDWNTYTSKGAVYGMPHFNGKNILIVAAEDNPFWRSFLPPSDQMPQGLREQILSVYKNCDGKLSMQAFFDLLAIHELGHAFHLQGGLLMQRQWMGELFANVLLHAYIAENEPESLPALTLFPQMVVGGGSQEYKYTSLQDIEDQYNEIARNYPKNYGWYQCRWHMAAADIYNAAGRQVCKKLWDALKNKKEKLPDAELINFLDSAADKSVADVMKNWDR